MKLTKKDLKDLMKECLREVLKEEGVVLKEYVSNAKILSNKTNFVKQKTSIPKSTFENIASSDMEAVNEILHGFKGKDAELMAEIFADTARTTLQEQKIGHQSFDVDGMGSYTRDDSENPAVNDHSLKALAPNGDVNRWAKIALAASKK